MEHPAFTVMAFLVEETREARRHALPPAYEYHLDTLLRQQERRVIRRERLAERMAAADAETPTNPAT